MKQQLWLHYKVDQGIPPLLSKAFQQGQFKEATEKQKHDSWNVYWKACGFTHSDYKNVKPWQILNHFPKANLITRKDSLARSLKRMRMVYGSVYNFSPVSFNLPNDYTKFLSYHTKIQNKKGRQVWICKPSDLSRGRGIFLFNCVSDLLYDGPTVVQRYIEDPYLIGGYKFDLRLYVVVTSYHPLRIYIHHDGLVRFSTEKYGGSMLHNVFAHLTNTSINRKGPHYNSDKERIGSGCKWSISQLRAYFQQCSVDDRLAWERIKHMITLTILTQTNAVPDTARQCIELYGFDIILDSKMKPWLLEVNFTPALGNDCQADVSVKLPMLVDLLTLAKHKMNLPKQSEQPVKKKSYKSDAKREAPSPEVIDFDDAFRARFIMSPAEPTTESHLQRKFMKIPQIKKTSSILEQNYVTEEDSRHSVKSEQASTDSSAKCNSAKPPSTTALPSTSRKTRSKSSGASNSVRTYNTNRTFSGADNVQPSEYKIGGFYLTYPINNNNQDSAPGITGYYNKGNLDVGKAVANIKSTLKISEANFKFLPAPEKRQLHETTVVKWNSLSGFKTSIN